MAKTKSDGDQNGFGHHLTMMIKSILVSIQWWQPNPF
jgi:hypothetical protein